MILIKQRSYLHVSSLIKCHWKRCTQCIKLYSSEVQEQALNQDSEGPLSVYKEKVANGTITLDPHQENVVQHLESIYKSVINYERPVVKPQGSGIFSFFRKSQPQKIIAPQGLYIYGSVGGGKTMLMDLFYETVPVSVLANHSKALRLVSFKYFCLEVFLYDICR